jgi:ribosomal protein S21
MYYQRNNGICVYLRKDESVLDLIGRFKKKVNKSKILKEARNRQYFIKTSEKKRLKKLKVIYEKNKNKNRKKKGK